MKVFVDGQAGTTGLKIHERLASRSDIELLKIPEEKRKDIETRREYLNNADIVFLCLPDDAARESVSLVINDKTKIIDASTAHRTNPDWAYGLPELSIAHRSRIESSKRVANPGCHATGFNIAMYPLVHEGIISKEYPVTCHSVTGYSGGGNKLINQYENTENRKEFFTSSRHYALGLTHKHLPEMQKISGLAYSPHFQPIIGDFYQGMAVSVPLFKRQLDKKLTAKEMQEFFSAYYENQHFIKVMPFESAAYLDDGCFNPMACNNTNRAELFVFGNDEQILIITRLDNLGKGASGAAVQNMNIMLGIDERTGLE